MDVSNKLFYIEKIKRRNFRSWWLDNVDVSVEIENKYKAKISPTEVGEITKEYAPLLKINRIYVFVLLLFTQIACVAISDSMYDWIIVAALIPCFAVVIGDVDLAVRLWAFDEFHLKPSRPQSEAHLGSVAIVLASRNEPFHVAKMTFDSALKAEYPAGKKQIIIVDNSDETNPDYALWKSYVETFCSSGSQHDSSLRVAFIHRHGTQGFKPLNLDMALKSVASDYILYLDIDSSIPADALIRSVPLFGLNEKIGFVQLQTVPTNSRGSSALALPQGIRTYFLRLETGFNSHVSHSLFYGHNALWRSDLVRAIGSCLEHINDEVIVTEDLSMTLRASFKGYHGITAWIKTGEWVPESLKETEAMWLRWTVGTYQVYAKHFINIARIRRAGCRELLGWIQHLTSLVCGGLQPVFVAAGLFFNSYPLLTMSAAAYLPLLIKSCVAFRKLKLGKIGWFEKIVVCYQSFFILGAFIDWVRAVGLFRFVVGSKQGWVPTAKSTGSCISTSRAIWERAGLMLFSIASMALAAYSALQLQESHFDQFLVFVSGFYGLNCMLAVLIFGRSRMREDTKSAAGSGTIDDYSGFYSGDDVNGCRLPQQVCK